MNRGAGRNRFNIRYPSHNLKRIQHRYLTVKRVPHPRRVLCDRVGTLTSAVNLTSTRSYSRNSRTDSKYHSAS